MPAEQFDLLLEVKCAPMSSSISLSERDLDGIRVDPNSNDIGALAVLDDHNSYRCGMIFIEIQNIPRSMIGTTQKSELPLGSDSATLAHISSRWDDWVLRTGAIENVFEDEHSRIPDAPIFPALTNSSANRRPNATSHNRKTRTDTMRATNAPPTYSL